MRYGIEGFLIYLVLLYTSYVNKKCYASVQMIIKVYTIYVLWLNHTRFRYILNMFETFHAFDVIYMAIWTSPVLVTTVAEHFLLIVDDFSHFL